MDLMSDVKGRAEQAKGHVKEAVGDLTDDDDLRDEGKRDRASGAAKEKVEQAKDKLEEGIDRVKDKLGKDRS
jgi:uncharacterized protein YjbJ (UPF0337 family)